MDSQFIFHLFRFSVIFLCTLGTCSLRSLFFLDIHLLNHFNSYLEVLLWKFSIVSSSSWTVLCIASYRHTGTDHTLYMFSIWLIALIVIEHRLIQYLIENEFVMVDYNAVYVTWLACFSVHLFQFYFLFSRWKVSFC